MLFVKLGIVDKNVGNFPKKPLYYNHLKGIFGKCLKKCKFCHSTQVQKYGKTGQKQRYYCVVCQHTFIDKPRLNSDEIWYQYSQRKLTLAQLAKDYHCSVRTIQRHLNKACKHQINSYPSTATIVMDTTYFKRRFGVLVLVDSGTTQVLYVKFVKNETNGEYINAINTLKAKGIQINSITCDGRRGLLTAFSEPVQLCQFHQVAIVTRNLTKNPKSCAGIELRQLTLTLKTSSKAQFTQALQAWYVKHQVYLNERSDSNDKRFKHRKLRSAYHSLKRNLPYLFTYEDYQHLYRIDKTTNRLEGLFSELKKLLLVHNGLSDKNKQMFIADFLARK